MEIILVIYAAYWLITTAATDLKYAAQGKTSPRWQAKLEKLRQQGRPDYKPRYGSRAWAADLWGDWLQAKTEARRENTAASRAEREPASAEQRLTAALAPEKPHIPAQVIHTNLTPTPPPTFPERLPVAPGKVIQMFPKKEEGSTMSEVTGLDPAINHARAVASAHDLHAGDETFVNGLAAAGHGDTVTNAAAHAQTKSQEAAEAWNALADALETKNKAVQEAYRNSGGEAAGKDHLLSGI